MVLCEIHTLHFSIMS